MTDRVPPHPEHIRQAAQWLADGRQFAVGPTGLVLTQESLAPVLPTVKARFGLTDADAAEAVLLAGYYSICRRAFG
jgi:hypothetical protein